MAPRTYERRGTHGAAASTHHLATSTAMAVLARGGNAFDAVVAGGFVLQVVEPHMCGPGGEVPAVFVTAGDPTPRVLCAQGVAPGRATTALLRDELGLAAIPGTGLLPATVPGAWDGWLTLLRDHGTFPLADVLGPALAYAEHGFPLAPPVPTTIAAVEQHLREHWPSSAATWLPDGRVPTTTHRLPALAATWRRLLAEAVGPTREAQIDAARAAWYRGFVAEAIEEFMATPVRDATGRDHAGLLTADDLAGWSCSYEDAVVVEAGGGWAVAKPGPWSQGPVLAQTLQLLRDADLEYVDGVPSEATVHRVAEAAKLAFADREAWYGDSAPVPLEALVSRAYADERRALIAETASMELRPGAPGGAAPRLAAATAPGGSRGDGVTPAGIGEPTAAQAPGVGEPTAPDRARPSAPPAAGPRGGGPAGRAESGSGHPPTAGSGTSAGGHASPAGRGTADAAPGGRSAPTAGWGAGDAAVPGGRSAPMAERGGAGLGEPTVGPEGVMRGDTVHIDVVDAAGNMVSATPSGGWLQSSPTIPGLGFCLGTRGQMFWLEDGLASSLRPGRRPRTTLSPSLGLRDGEPVLAFGTPGGDQQDQWQLCFWLAHTVGGLDLQAAIDAPTWHSTAFPSSFAPRGWEPGGLVVESRLGRSTLEALRRRGHLVTDAGPWALGRRCAVGRGDLLRAAADPRSGYGGAAAH
jgi:gamma-glutamyltranspeptidase/glutathione hydrolase